MDATSSNKRRNEILKALINLYIEQVKPISSKLIKQRYGLSVSTATIRNAMHELEEGGYIKQPHTSSGRVPTDKGYRCYIDSLMGEEGLSSIEKQRLKRKYQPLSERVEDVVDKTAEILSLMSYEVAISLFFNFKESLLRHVDLVNVSGGRVLIVVVTESGLIRHYLVKLEEPVSDSQLREMSNYININLQDTALSDIKAGLDNHLKREEDASVNLLKKALGIFSAIDIFEDEYELYQEGISYILKKPEFKDVNKLRSVLDVLENKETIAQILKNNFEPTMTKVKVLIGRENKFKNLQECSLVTSNYKIADRTVGILSLLGPTRMAYSKILPLVEYMSEVLSSTLTRCALDYKEETQDESV
jgi:heat-inducible transcriptional repressor